ncbi:uncharacterized protein LOC142330708 [Lycorma delicatula]|uniref:uncharacterized protein LOC142330708 n=1 Tax=Lycorma delicatula TaxID=130591 RepID=UPI003F50E030
MTQPDLPYFPFLAHPVCSCTSSCTIPKKQLTTKKLKKIKKQEIRNVNLEQLESNSHSLELEIKKIMESIQIFEKQKQEFLSSLSKIQANISSLSLTQPVYVKEVAENDEKIKIL